MRQSVVSLLVAAGALCILCSNCRSSERKPAPAVGRDASRSTSQPIRLAARQGSGAPDLARLNSLLDTSSFETTASQHFVVLHQPNASYAEGACRTLEYAYRHFYEVFAQAGFNLSHPTGRLVWICFPQKSGFSTYAQRAEGMDLSWLDGYYSTLTNCVAVVQPDRQKGPAEEPVKPSAGRVPAAAANRPSQGGVLALPTADQQFDVTRMTHEVAHQLAFNSGIQKRGVMYPLWVSEGLATNFEFDTSLVAGLDHCNAPRCRGLLEAYQAGELTPLKQFVVQATVPADAHLGRQYYAQAWGFFQFILTERPENLRTYLHHLAADRSERRDARTLLREFTQAFGSPEALELDWNEFLARELRQASAHSPTPAPMPEAGQAR